MQCGELRWRGSKPLRLDLLKHFRSVRVLAASNELDFFRFERRFHLFGGEGKLYSSERFESDGGIYRSCATDKILELN